MRKPAAVAFACILIWLVWAPDSIPQSDFDWGWSGAADNSALLENCFNNSSSSDSTRFLASFLIELYQRQISPRQGHRCPCFPSCSAFTLEAIQKRGYLFGIVMGFERMFIRENTDLFNFRYYVPYVDMEGRTRAYDPPEANFVFKAYDWRIIDPHLDIHRLERLQSPK